MIFLFSLILSFVFANFFHKSWNYYDKIYNKHSKMRKERSKMLSYGSIIMFLVIINIISAFSIFKTINIVQYVLVYLFSIFTWCLSDKHYKTFFMKSLIVTISLWLIYLIMVLVWMQ